MDMVAANLEHAFDGLGGLHEHHPVLLYTLDWSTGFHGAQRELAVHAEVRGFHVVEAHRIGDKGLIHRLARLGDGDMPDLATGVARDHMAFVVDPDDQVHAPRQYKSEV